MAFVERRKHPRFRVTMPVSFSGHTGTGSGQAQDLSMEGCRIESDAVPKVGDYLELSLRFPEPELPLRIDSAAVRWVRGQLFGVEFLYMPTESLKRLPRLIEGLRKQPPADAPTDPGKRGDG